MKPDDCNEIDISDFYLSAYLCCMGHKIKCTRKNGKRTFFVFENKRRVKNAIQAFYNREDKVSAIDYKNTISDLKSLLYSLERCEKNGDEQSSIVSTSITHKR